jgi:hypothetical protein
VGEERVWTMAVDFFGWLEWESELSCGKILGAAVGAGCTLCGLVGSWFVVWGRQDVY